MTPKAYIQQSFLNFTTAKLRTFLAMLGILVGTAAIVTLLSTGKLATEAALAQFKRMGTNLLSVTLYATPTTQATRGRSKSISLNTWRQFPALIPNIQDIAPYSTLYQPISYQGKSLNASIIGADESLKRILHLSLSEGHFISSFESYERHCIIGDALAKEIQSHDYGSPIGKSISIGTSLYTIIGILTPWTENAFLNEDLNHSLILPIKGMRLIIPHPTLQNAILLTNEKIDIDETILSLKSTILNQAPSQNIFIRSAKQIIDGMQKQSDIFTLLLGTIGGIALIVGGIGIMNIMLVSVSERKQEIGVRKALGATNQSIQSLFLTEAILISLLGGISGAILGILATRLIAYFNHWPYLFYGLPLLIGSGVSILTGIFFGFYPAHRAAKLDPAISLRL